MIVEFIAGRDEVKQVRDKNNEIRGLTQECYFYVPNSAYPIGGKMRVKAPVAPGKYNFEPAYQTGKFGDLEINPFATPELRPARPEQVKATG